MPRARRQQRARERDQTGDRQTAPTDEPGPWYFATLSGQLRVVANGADVELARDPPQPTVRRGNEAVSGPHLPQEGRRRRRSAIRARRSLPRTALRRSRRNRHPRSSPFRPSGPGAVWYVQYRLVCAMTLSGGGAPHSDWSSVVCASLTSVASYPLRQRAVQRRADALIRLRSDDHEAADTKAREHGLEGCVLE